MASALFSGHFLLLLLLLGATPSSATSNTAALESQLERSILVTLYTQTNGPGWTINTNWMSAEVHYCDWHGISCTTPGSASRRYLTLTSTSSSSSASGTQEARSIEAIDLSENNLQGSVPFSLLVLLPNIHSIILRGNDINFVNTTSSEVQVLGKPLDQLGTVTSVIQHIDVSYTKLNDLAFLFQAGNSNSTTLIKAPSLTELYASQAGIEGSFPHFVFTMTSLQHLALDQNSITGFLPNTIGNCRQLNFIDMSANSISGTIPATVNQLIKLRYFLMESNQLHGTIPLGLVSGEYTPLLEQLDLSNQRSVLSNPSSRVALTGIIPSFNTQKRLRRVDLGVNSFTGTIPSNLLQGIANLADFDYIILASNALTGSVPSSVIHRIPVDALFLENNRITQVNKADCSSLRFGCDGFLCPPGYYESRGGRQEEASRKCQECKENTKYWGQTVCQVGESTTPSAPSLGASPTAAPVVSPTAISQEMQILVSLYNATGGDNWSDRKGWSKTLSSSSSICTWFGIECVESGVSVLSIRLPANRLVGTIPSAIFQLPNLQAIDFSLNDNLTFNFGGIGSCPSLRYIDLSSVGALEDFDSIQNVSGTLEQLVLSSVSAFSGSTLPSVLWNMTNLQRLILDYDNFLGPIPTDIGNLTNLVAFSASVNELTGSLPETLSMMTDLTFLRLATNHLQGALPDSLQNMTNLNVLELSNQWSNGVDDNFDNSARPGLSGTLPAFVGFSQLQRLDLSVNSFTGSIPENFLSDVSQDGGFQYADISVNFLTGTVSSSVANLSIVYMQDNHLTGIEPSACNQLPANLSAFGCDAVLCPPRSFNALGRQTSADGPCQPCDGNAPYYGSTTCPSPSNIGSPQTLSNDTVMQALASIYNSCGGSSWATKGGWLDVSASVCTWDGIRCSTDDDVVGISLRSNNLVGTFPSKQVFVGIPGLQALVLEENDINFPFDGIDQALNLKTLDLTSTQVSTAQGLEMAPALENVFLGSNLLTGSFPTGLLVLTKLKRLTLAFNSFQGSIPTDLGKLTRLEFLSLHDNSISGAIPSQLGKLSMLTFLLLQGNNLSGTIPESLNFLTNLKNLDLSQQGGLNEGGLNGTLPSFAAMPHLQYIDLHQNRLSGSIPGDFLNKTAVATFETLDLSENLLTGTAPAILQKFTVNEYDLTGNRITSIDPKLCAQSLGGDVASFGCSAVLCPIGTYNDEGRQKSSSDVCMPCAKNIYLGGRSCGPITFSPTPSPVNELSDGIILSQFYDALGGSRWVRKDRWKSTSAPVCNWFGVHCSSDGNQHVEQIVLPTNNLIGTVPTQIFQLPYLETLILNSNKIQIDLSFVNNSRSLLTLDLSNTGIRSVEGIGGSKLLRDLNIASNMLRGSIPEEIFNIGTLEQLTFDYNSLTGLLSSKLQSLSNLRLLSGVKNSLTGSIPSELLQLTSLVSLKLAMNSLIGTLPSGFSSLTELSVIDLSHCALTGPLPSFSGVTTITQFDLSNNDLSGTIPTNFLDSVNAGDFEYADLSSNSITGKLAASLSRLGNIYVQDNQITGIAPELCNVTRGLVFGFYGCDAVLCPPGTYSSHGRQESDASYCQNCTQSLFYGATECPQKGSVSSVTGPKVDTRQVLIDLYQTCGGQSWDDNTNWLKVSVSICEWFGIICAPSSEEVATIELGANNLVGTPPTELYALPALRALSLYSNPLGEVNFDGIQYATKLNDLKLDATGLTSITGVGNAPNLTSLNLRFNQLQGTFSTELAKLTMLQSLNLAHNELTGSLPAVLEKLSNLEALLLSYNQIDGSLQGVNFPSSMRLLDLSNNALTGSIPEAFLTEVPFDAQLDVDLSENQLTGAVPTALTRFANLNIYLESNQITQLDPQLCTQPLWNDGDVGRFGCAGLLCPPDEYAPQGRQTSLEVPCQSCGTSRVYGTADCGNSASASVYGGSYHWFPSYLAVLAVLWVTVR
jgi:Leucine-rich repeat (LRR) protein